MPDQGLPPGNGINPHLHELLDDLAETLAEANGAGLAAPQVGVLRRVCLVMMMSPVSTSSWSIRKSLPRAASRPVWRAA